MKRKPFYQNDKLHRESDVVERFAVNTNGGTAIVLRCNGGETVAESECLKIIGVALGETDGQLGLVVVSEVPGSGYVHSLIEYEVFQQIYAKIVESVNEGNHG